MVYEWPLIQGAFWVQNDKNDKNDKNVSRIVKIIHSAYCLGILGSISVSISEVDIYCLEGLFSGNPYLIHACLASLPTAIFWQVFLE